MKFKGNESIVRIIEVTLLYTLGIYATSSKCKYGPSVYLYMHRGVERNVNTFSYGFIDCSWRILLPCQWKHKHAHFKIRSLSTLISLNCFTVSFIYCRSRFPFWWWRTHMKILIKCSHVFLDDRPYPSRAYKRDWLELLSSHCGFTFMYDVKGHNKGVVTPMWNTAVDRQAERGTTSDRTQRGQNGSGKIRARPAQVQPTLWQSDKGVVELEFYLK